MRRPESYLEELVEGIEIKSVLDVGTGHGGVFHYGWWQKQSLERGACVDIHSIRPDIPGWEYHIADARELPFPDNSFDHVQCLEMIEHVPTEDHERVIEELKRVTRKTVFLTTSGKAAHVGPEQETIEKVNPYQKYRKIVDRELLLDKGYNIVYYHKGLNEKGVLREHIKACWVREDI